MSDLSYLSGFGNHHETEAHPNSLPIGRNTPQQAPHGLYAEQLSGSAFTASPRENNLRSWLYRILPSVSHAPYQPLAHAAFSKDITFTHTPQQLRWRPLESPSASTDFIDGLHPWVNNGGIEQGAAVYLYAANQSMTDKFFYNADADMLLVPQLGALNVHTEFGTLALTPSEIAVIPRGIKCQIELIDTQARGYLLENFGAPLKLPELGPIGANGLANPRDFLAPTAAYFEDKGTYSIVTKYGNTLWTLEQSHHPFNVVAWHGNYYPYKYDLKRFNTMNTVSFDHPDPSIFTVLTSQTTSPGVANIDFVIFPERWMVAEDTFRPPYYHRNIMSEYMGLIYGSYDAKPDAFQPGGSSVHNCMSAHGPDATSFEKASREKLEPKKQKDTLAFMFETRLPWQVSNVAMNSSLLDQDYHSHWQALTTHWKKS